MKIGNRVRIVRCAHCPAVVGKEATITDFRVEMCDTYACLRFGRGRPMKDRPKSIKMDDLSLVVREIEA
jgi:hypothetical protein